MSSNTHYNQNTTQNRSDCTLLCVCANLEIAVRASFRQMLEFHGDLETSVDSRLRMSTETEALRYIHTHNVKEKII